MGNAGERWEHPAFHIRDLKKQVKKRMAPTQT